jgi:hypothetical protein
LLTKPYARFHSFVGGDDRILLLTRSWKSMARLVSFARDIDQEQTFLHLVEPRAGSSTYVRRVGWGNPQPRSLGYYTWSNPYTRHVIQLWESDSDVELNVSTFYWTGPPWFLPKPFPAVKLFLETWCQPKSKPLFSFESATTKTTFSGKSAFSRLVENFERPNLS